MNDFAYGLTQSWSLPATLDPKGPLGMPDLAPIRGVSASIPLDRLQLNRSDDKWFKDRRIQRVPKRAKSIFQFSRGSRAIVTGGANPANAYPSVADDDVLKLIFSEIAIDDIRRSIEREFQKPTESNDSRKLLLQLREFCVLIPRRSPVMDWVSYFELTDEANTATVSSLQGQFKDLEELIENLWPVVYAILNSLECGLYPREAPPPVLPTAECCSPERLKKLRSALQEAQTEEQREERRIQPEKWPVGMVPNREWWRYRDEPFSLPDSIIANKHWDFDPSEEVTYQEHFFIHGTKKDLDSLKARFELDLHNLDAPLEGPIYAALSSTSVTVWLVPEKMELHRKPESIEATGSSTKDHGPMALMMQSCLSLELMKHVAFLSRICATMMSAGVGHEDGLSFGAREVRVTVFKNLAALEAMFTRSRRLSDFGREYFEKDRRLCNGVELWDRAKENGGNALKLAEGIESETQARLGEAFAWLGAIFAAAGGAGLFMQAWDFAHVARLRDADFSAHRFDLAVGALVPAASICLGGLCLFAWRRLKRRARTKSSRFWLSWMV